MKRTLIRYKTRPEAADQNAGLIEKVFEELKAAKPGGVRYLSLRLDDNSFVPLVEAEEGRSGAEAAERRITTILASLPDAINVFDHDWRWQYLNENAAALWATLGHDHTDLVGRVLWDEFPELANTRFSSMVAQALKSGTVATLQAPLASTTARDRKSPWLVETW